MLRGYEGCGEYIRQVRNPLSRTPDRHSSRSGNRTPRHHHNVDRAISKQWSLIFLPAHLETRGGHGKKRKKKERHFHHSSKCPSTLRCPGGLSVVYDVHTVVRAVGSRLSSFCFCSPIFFPSLAFHFFFFFFIPVQLWREMGSSIRTSMVISGP